MKMQLTGVLFLLLLVSESAFCWGHRGHHTICTAAPHIVKNDSLKKFLKYRIHIMGHLCNIPDTHWRSMSSDVSDLGNPTHYINTEIIGLKQKDSPLDFHLIRDRYTGTDNLFKGRGKIFSIPKELGSLWWRADQFFRFVSDLKSSFTGVELPKNSKEEQDEKFAYNQSVYNMMIYMGVMGHYIGDASQPFHSTADYDGYSIGHGGIHSYYEEQIISGFGPDFEKQIVDRAKTIKDKKLVSGTPVEILRQLTMLGEIDRAKVIKDDPVLKKSEIKNEKGMEIKIPADRKSIDVGFSKFKDLIITQMARSAIVLAHFWDESYHNAGSPSLQAYKSFRYPHTPDFIPPDYIGQPSNKK